MSDIFDRQTPLTWELRNRCVAVTHQPTKLLHLCGEEFGLGQEDEWIQNIPPLEKKLSQKVALVPLEHKVIEHLNLCLHLS